MRKLFIFLLLAPVLSFGQTENPYKHMVLADGQVSYQNVYDAPGTQKGALFKLLNKYIPTIPSLGEYNADTSGTITARFVDIHIPYRQYGGHTIGGWAPVKCPINANVTILIKDEKYKVIISGILFDLRGLGKDWPIMSIEELTTKKKQTEFINKKMVVEGVIIMQNYFTKNFTLKEQNNDW